MCQAIIILSKQKEIEMANHKRILTSDLAPLMHELGKFTLNQLIKALEKSGMTAQRDSMQSRLSRLAKKIDPETKKPYINKYVEDDGIYYRVSKNQAARLCEQVRAAESRTLSVDDHYSTWGNLLIGKPGTTITMMPG